MQRHLADLPALISCTFLEVSRPCSTRVWVKFSSPGKDSCCSFSVLKYPSVFLSFSKANVLQCGCFNHPILGVNKVQFWFVKPKICWLNGQFFVALTIPSFGINPNFDAYPFLAQHGVTYFPLDQCAWTDRAGGH